MIAKGVAAAVSAALIAGCATLQQATSQAQGQAQNQAQTSSTTQTVGELVSTYGYVPLDPMPVVTKADCSGDTVSSPSPPKASPTGDPAAAKKKTAPAAAVRGAAPPAAALAAQSPQLGCSLPFDFPDLTVRIAIAKLDQSGSFEFGAVKAAAANSTYKVIFDFINADQVGHQVTATPVFSGACDPAMDGTTTALDINFRRMLRETSEDPKAACRATLLVESVPFPSTKSFDPPFATAGGQKRGKASRVALPIFIGVGLRVTADITTVSLSADAKINLASLAGIGAAASNNQLVGTLTFQTLGVTGSDVMPLVPVPSKLDETTVSNALIAVGEIKALLSKGASEDATSRNKLRISPRILGFYNSLPGGSETVNQVIVDLIQTQSVQWPNNLRY
jgi:hypothetical protein